MQLEKQQLTFTVEVPFGNLLRKRCVLIAVETKRGRFLLGAKPDFYPPSIVRFLGGGVNEDETFEQAAIRELAEELHVTLSVSRLLPLMLFDSSATDTHGTIYSNQTAVFMARIGNMAYRPDDDIAAVVEMSPLEIQELGAHYQSFPEDLWHHGHKCSHRWIDYGKLYGPLHAIVGRRLEQIAES